jgi:hypothetical protein
MSRTGAEPVGSAVRFDLALPSAYKARRRRSGTAASSEYRVSAFAGAAGAAQRGKDGGKGVPGDGAAPVHRQPDHGRS